MFIPPFEKNAKVIYLLNNQLTNFPTVSSCFRRALASLHRDPYFWLKIEEVDNATSHNVSTMSISDRVKYFFIF